MFDFIISLIISSVLMTAAAGILLITLRKGLLQWITPSGRALLWLVLIAGLLFPMKPVVFTPVVEVKAPEFLHGSDVWELVNSGANMSDMKQKISDALLDAVSTDYDSKAAFTKAAGEYITRAVGNMGDFVELDIIEQEK